MCSKDLTVTLTNICVNCNCVSLCNTGRKGCWKSSLTTNDTTKATLIILASYNANARFYLGIQVTAWKNMCMINMVTTAINWVCLLITRVLRAGSAIASRIFLPQRALNFLRVHDYIDSKTRIKNCTLLISEQCFYINKIWFSWQAHCGKFRPIFCCNCYPVFVWGCPFLWTYIQNAAIHIHFYHSE